MQHLVTLYSLCTNSTDAKRALIFIFGLSVIVVPFDALLVTTATLHECGGRRIPLQFGGTMIQVVTTRNSPPS